MHPLAPCLSNRHKQPASSSSFHTVTPLSSRAALDGGSSGVTGNSKLNHLNINNMCIDRCCWTWTWFQKMIWIANSSAVKYYCHRTSWVSVKEQCTAHNTMPRLKSAVLMCTRVNLYKYSVIRLLLITQPSMVDILKLTLQQRLKEQV